MQTATSGRARSAARGAPAGGGPGGIRREARMPAHFSDVGCRPGKPPSTDCQAGRVASVRYPSRVVPEQSRQRSCTAPGWLGLAPGKRKVTEMGRLTAAERQRVNAHRALTRAPAGPAAARTDDRDSARRGGRGAGGAAAIVALAALAPLAWPP